MRAISMLFLSAMVIVSACVSIAAVNYQKRVIGDQTYIVVTHVEIVGLDGDPDGDDKITSRNVYVVANDGRYRHIGGWTPSSTVFLTQGSGFSGYTQKDLERVELVISETGEYIARNGINPKSLDDAVRIMTGSEPERIGDVRPLIYSRSPIGTGAPDQQPSENQGE